MVTFLIRRIFFLILTLIAVSILVFAISELAPGNIAVNTLGNTITPEQEKSFNAQNGLDQPAVTRYVRWLIGSDWQLSQNIGNPVVRVRNQSNGRISWWVQAPDGTLYQNFTDDGEIIQRRVLQMDGSFVDTQSADDQWQTNADGIDIFWGINLENRGAMWVRGDDQQEWVITSATWTSAAGAPRQYIPLQKGLLRGDPGVSFKDRRPVAEILPRRLRNTAILAGLAFIIVMPLALVFGLIAGLNEGTFLDRFLSISSLVATATPEFASGVFLIVIFSTWLDLLPGAVVMTNDNALFERPSMLVLPIMTLMLIELGYILRITRSSMVEVMQTNYIRTAILKGLPWRRVVFKHALRNALLAPITVIMLHINWLISGIVIVEVLFAFPGIGRYILEAALFKDVFAIEAAAMLMVVIAVGTQLLADIIYTYLNPRIRYS
ncbi:MAG: ABC transporter permease [Chloroflexota bacterium]